MCECVYVEIKAKLSAGRESITVVLPTLHTSSTHFMLTGKAMFTPLLPLSAVRVLPLSDPPFLCSHIVFRFPVSLAAEQFWFLSFCFAGLSKVLSHLVFTRKLCRCPAPVHYSSPTISSCLHTWHKSSLSHCISFRALKQAKVDRNGKQFLTMRVNFRNQVLVLINTEVLHWLITEAIISSFSLSHSLYLSLSFSLSHLKHEWSTQRFHMGPVQSCRSSVQ